MERKLLIILADMIPFFFKYKTRESLCVCGISTSCGGELESKVIAFENAQPAVNYICASV